ncbi:hypothetical protein ABENE_03835 [Asticcacaulis benevestitus DSM 16100 = ATCC BAA-896]|uniref:Uncharacterized protein n=1 Tax=Asticcacaulis benevestitus DSM 16100 = ATCC BAA-896 TaxID=1121022 RepID=V4Q2B4_9CAUL|nr:hypothetical protein ABENE_03835 [Asticcacaulis benevestitus DSM 16100 = ATCC BAA-896]
MVYLRFVLIPSLKDYAHKAKRGTPKPVKVLARAKPAAAFAASPQYD